MSDLAIRAVLDRAGRLNTAWQQRTLRARTRGWRPMTVSPPPPRAPHAAAVSLRVASGLSPRAAIILGSGLGPVADVMPDAVTVAYGDIPQMPVPAAPGHAGKVLLGHISDLPVMVFSGRVHLYEGWAPTDVTFPVDVAAELGVETVIVTNAAGGVNPGFGVGQLMLISDHINLLGSNPLTGPLPPEQPAPFVPISRAYSDELLSEALARGRSAGLDITSGVYLATPGPTFETPAEVRMMRTLGADAVGMSTVPEVIRATWHGMDTLGISVITNLAAGLATGEHDPGHIGRTAAAAAPSVATIVSGICDHLR